MTAIRATTAAVCALVLAACGQAGRSAAISSTPRATPFVTASPTVVASSTPSPSATPLPSQPPTSPLASSSGARLVVFDYTHTQVRLALENANDIATVPGQFDGVVGGQAIVVNGQDLLAVSRTGSVRKLGRLAGQPQWTGVGTVAVNPSLSEWVYTLVSFTDLTSRIHLGSPSSDSLIATVPSPDGNSFYQAFTWNSSGAYMVRQGTGLGGVGAFIEFHFPLARIDVSTGQVTMVSPSCTAETVLDDGTFLCRTSSGAVEVRPPSGAGHTIQLASTTAGIYSKLTLTGDQKHLVAARNGSTDPSKINYQIVAADLTSTSAGVFGPFDFLPDAWLPDGRLVADHLCWTFQGNGGPCDQSLDGTYFISADRQSRTLFYKLAAGSVVVASI